MDHDEIDQAIGDLFQDVFYAVKASLDRAEMVGLYINNRNETQSEIAQHALDTIRRKIRAKQLENEAGYSVAWKQCT